MASITKVIPLFTQSSSATSLIDALWWWGWSGSGWSGWGGSGSAFALFNHLFASWASALVFASPLSPGNWSAVLCTRTFIDTRFWSVAFTDFLVAWLSISKIVSNNGVDLHSWTITGDVNLWWARFWLASSFVTAGNSVIRVDGGESGFTWKQFFGGSSAFSSVRSDMLVELEFSHN